MPITDNFLRQQTERIPSIALGNEVVSYAKRAREVNPSRTYAIEVKTFPTHGTRNVLLHQQLDHHTLAPDLINFHFSLSQPPIREDMTRKYPRLGLSQPIPIDLSEERQSVRWTPIPTISIDDSDNEIDLTSEDDELEFQRELTLQEVRDFEQARVQPNALPRGHRLLKGVRGPYDIVVESEKGFQLRPTNEGETNFFWVKRIIENDRGEVFLRGIYLKRNIHIHRETSKTTGMDRHAVLPLLKNDLCMQLKSTIDQAGSPTRDECLSTIPLHLVESEREIVFTNYDFPAFNYQQRGMSVYIDRVSKVEEHGVLCCRWKYTEEVIPGSRKIVGHSLVRLEHHECDKGKGRLSVEMQRGYGDLKHTQTATRPNLERAKKYTAGDACAGGGGTARGAEMAGLKLKWLLDNDPIAADTLHQNWPHMRVLRMEVQRFANARRSNNNYRVDVLHVSFPCQGHSRRNRGTNPERDAINNATVMCLGELLENYKPRILTLEQTSHIRTTNDGYYYRKVISQITDKGYAVQWRNVNMAEHGVPQARTRLMVMAAAPGQKLPQWPAPTHDGPGLKPRVTVGEAIRNIPRWATQHDIAKQKRKYRMKPLGRPVADQGRPLRELIATNGIQALFRDQDGELYDPTIRQQMRLQTFPDHHILAGSAKKDITTQIGNAVPCIYMEQLFTEVIKALRESDEEAEAWEQEIMEID